MSDNYTVDGSGIGSFISTATGLSSDGIYIIRAYATNSAGTSYGNSIVLKAGVGVIENVEGTIYAEYSVSNTKKVYFSKGNLQYQASTNIWRFAETQFDCVGNGNDNISSSSYSGWIDLFGWGTGNYPDNASTNENNYSNYVEWGNKPISNGGNVANQWRTLTKDEWYFLLFNRITTSGIRFAKAKVGSMCGLIILPDDWDDSYYTLNSGTSFSSNIITPTIWTNEFEAHGAVFLPAAGHRRGTSTYGYRSEGHYWSSTPEPVYEFSYCLKIKDATSLYMSDDDRSEGKSVRLVYDAN